MSFLASNSIPWATIAQGAAAAGSAIDPSFSPVFTGLLNMQSRKAELKLAQDKQDAELEHQRTMTGLAVDEAGRQATAAQEATEAHQEESAKRVADAGAATERVLSGRARAGDTTLLTQANMNSLDKAPGGGEGQNYTTTQQPLAASGNLPSASTAGNADLPPGQSPAGDMSGNTPTTADLSPAPKPNPFARPAVMKGAAIPPPVDTSALTPAINGPSPDTLIPMGANGAAGFAPAPSTLLPMASPTGMVSTGGEAALPHQGKIIMTPEDQEKAIQTAKAKGFNALLQEQATAGKITQDTADTFGQAAILDPSKISELAIALHKDPKTITTAELDNAAELLYQQRALAKQGLAPALTPQQEAVITGYEARKTVVPDFAATAAGNRQASAQEQGNNLQAQAERNRRAEKGEDHLSDATKTYTTAIRSIQQQRQTIDLAATGNQVAGADQPVEVALGLGVGQGVKRVAPAQFAAMHDAGSLWQRLQNKLSTMKDGQPWTKDMQGDAQRLIDMQERLAYQQYYVAGNDIKGRYGNVGGMIAPPASVKQGTNKSGQRVISFDGGVTSEITK
jgi:hypothetical protein